MLAVVDVPVVDELTDAAVDVDAEVVVTPADVVVDVVADVVVCAVDDDDDTVAVVTPADVLYDVKSDVVVDKDEVDVFGVDVGVGICVVDVVDVVLSGTEIIKY